VRRSTGAIELLAPTRPVLGLLDQQIVGAERIRLGPGDGVAMYTDGITEAADANGEEFGPERLTNILSGDGLAKLQELHGRILSDVRGHASGKLADDATLVLISVGEVQTTHTSPISQHEWSRAES